MLPDLQVFFDLDTALHDDDGGARDVNLDGAAWSGVDALLVELVGRYAIAIAHGGDGTEVALPARVLDVVERELTIHVYFESKTCTPSELQLFVGEADGAPFIELTFYPEHASGFDAERFLNWVDALAETAGAAAWYFRYENEAWTVGDVGEESGVVAARVLPSGS